ncbi:flagellar biosynthetic protein FliO [bacterium]|nr:flagellar biosynthetic protein FliO [bacterium]
MLKYLITFSVYTLAMIGVIFIAFVVWKNSLNFGPKNKQSSIIIEESLSLNPRKTLYVIRIKNERFLIASDIDKTTFLAKLEGDETIADFKDVKQPKIQNSENIAEYTTGESFSMHKLLNKLSKDTEGEE